MPTRGINTYTVRHNNCENINKITDNLKLKEADVKSIDTLLMPNVI